MPAAPLPINIHPRPRAVKGALAILLAAGALLAALYLTGCARRVPRAVPVPAPGTAAVPEVRRAQALVRAHLTPAATRTETIIRTVETIRATADPATALALSEVQRGLLKVSADLRDALTGLTAADERALVAEQQTGTLRAWGVEQQTEAAANADGWRASEVTAKAAKASADKWAIAFHLRTAKLGMLAGLVGFFVGTKFSPLPPLKWWWGLGAAALAAAAAVAFL